MSEFFAGRDPTHALRERVKKIVPERYHAAFKPLTKTIARILNAPPTVSFIVPPPELPNLSYTDRMMLAYRIDRISRHVRCSHNQKQMLRIFRLVLGLPPGTPGCIVEAGSFKGGSGSKLSWLARMTNRRLHLFDSFAGMPENTERHEDGLWGQNLRDAFKAGEYRGSLDEVQDNIRKYGAPETCVYHKGWFEETMPGFSEKVCAAYIDVDLESSTRTCVKHLYPLLVPGGAIFSQDGHIPLVVKLLADEGFWRRELGCARPPMDGLGTDPLIVIHRSPDLPHIPQMGLS